MKGGDSITSIEFIMAAVFLIKDTCIVSDINTLKV